MTLEELRIVISAQTDDLRSELQQVTGQLGRLQNNTNSVTSSIRNSFKRLVTGVIALKIGQKIAQSISYGISEAMNIEAAIQQIKRIMGESSNQFLKWANTQAIAFNMGKSEAIKYGSVFGNLVMTFSKSTAETTKYTEDLLKASSIIASSTGRSMEDVMERIRSGLLGNTEAIEDLGVNVNVAMIESTEAFKKFANGKSWNQLEFQTQQQIRLMAILEQTTKKYGDSVKQNTSTQLAQLTAQLKNIQLSLGQAFLPILNIVLPILTKFASALAYITNLVAQFSQALFGKATSTKSQVSGINAQSSAVSDLGDSFKEAGDEAKNAGKEFNALSGFDEITSLNSSSGSGIGDYSGDSSDVGGTGIDMTGIGGVTPIDFSTNAPEISSTIENMADNVKSVLSVVFKPFRDSWDLYGVTVKGNIDVIFSDIKAICDEVGMTLYNIWANPSVQESVILLNGIFADLFSILTRIFDELVTPAMSDFLELIDPSKNPVAQNFVDGIKDILTNVKELTGYLSGDGFKFVKDFLALFIAFKSIQFVIEMGKATGAIVTNTIATIANTGAKIKSKIETGILIGMYAIEAVKKGISTAATWAQIAAQEVWNAITLVGNGIMTAFNIVLSLNPIFLMAAAIVGIVAGLVILYNKCEWFRNGVNSVFRGVWNGIKSVINLIIGGLNNLIRGLNKIKFNLPSWVPGVGGKSFGINIRSIPRLAKGGVVDSAQMFIAGEAGKEVVMPLENNTEWIDDLASKLNGKGKSSDGPITIILKIGNTEFGRAVINSLNEYARQNGELPLLI